MFKTTFLLVSSLQFFISAYSFMIHDYTTSTIFALWSILTFLVAQNKGKKD